MRIGVFGTTNTANYGTSMLTSNLITYLGKFFPNSEWLVDAKGEKRIKYLRSITDQYITEFPDIYAKNASKINKIMNFLNSNKVIKKAGINASIFLSGDSISETYGIKGLAYYLILINNLIKAGIPVFLVSQTMGPFFSWRKLLVRKVLKKAFIYSRDPINTNYLRREIKLNNVVQAADLAFLDLHKQSKPTLLNSLELRNLEPKKYVTLVPSGLARHYCNNYRDYISSWVKIIEAIRPSLDKHLKIVLLAHVLEKGANDRSVIKDILEQLGKFKAEDYVVVDNLIKIQEARIILGNGLFTITGRMHAAVSTFQMLKPAISLSYSVKYRGVIGEGLGMKDLVIEAKGGDLWESGDIVDMVMDRVDYVLNNYDRLIERIKPAVEESKRMAMAQIEDIAKKLKEVRT